MELRKCECGSNPKLFSTFYEGDGDTWFVECVECDGLFVTEDFDNSSDAVKAWNEWNLI